MFYIIKVKTPTAHATLFANSAANAATIIKEWGKRHVVLWAKFDTIEERTRFMNRCEV